MLGANRPYWGKLESAERWAQKVYIERGSGRLTTMYETTDKGTATEMA